MTRGNGNGGWGLDEENNVRMKLRIKIGIRYVHAMQRPVVFGSNSNDDSRGDCCRYRSVGADVVFVFLLQEPLATVSAFEFRNTGWVVTVRFDFKKHVAGKDKSTWWNTFQRSRRHTRYLESQFQLGWQASRKHRTDQKWCRRSSLVEILHEGESNSETHYRFTPLTQFCQPVKVYFP